MIIGARFDPTVLGSTTVLTALRIPNYNPLWGLMRLLVINPTGVNVDVSFVNGYVLHSPAHSRRFVEVESESDTVYWQIISYAGSYPNGTPPITVELYRPDEPAPMIYSDVTPLPLPPGQLAISHFSGTGTPSITLANVAGQLLVLDGWDLVASAASGTGSVTLTMTVAGILINGGGASNWKADYVMLQGTALATIDHQLFPNRGCVQQAGTAIVFSATLSATLGAGNNVLAAKYHYEINY